MDLAIIIVTWNVRILVLDALRSLYDDLAGSGLNTQVIVVDNASADDTLQAISEHFPQVHLIANETNLGFAGANNAGMRYLGFGSDMPAQGLPRAVYLLNPDTLTQRGTTRTLYDNLLAQDSYGLVGARLSYGDGRFQHAGFEFPGLRQLWAEFFPTPGRLLAGRFNGRYPQEQYGAEEPFEVDFMLGATMMLKREVILQTGMFDPQFFVYCEEIDWQWRIRKAGWQVMCVPQAHVVHLEGQSTGQVKPQSLRYLWDSRLRLFKKHYPAWKLWLAQRLVATGMWRKMQQAHHEKRSSEISEIIEAYQQIREMALSS